MIIRREWLRGASNRKAGRDHKAPSVLGDLEDNDESDEGSECILQGNAGSLASLGFCLAVGGCLLYLISGSLSASVDPMYCQRGGERNPGPTAGEAAALYPGAARGTAPGAVVRAAYLDSYFVLGAQVAKGQLGVGGRLGWARRCVGALPEPTQGATRGAPPAQEEGSFVASSLGEIAVASTAGDRSPAHGLALYAARGTSAWVTFDLARPAARRGYFRPDEAAMAATAAAAAGFNVLCTRAAVVDSTGGSGLLSGGGCGPVPVVFEVFDAGRRRLLWSSAPGQQAGPGASLLHPALRATPGASLEEEASLKAPAAVAALVGACVNVTGVRRLRLVVQALKGARGDGILDGGAHGVWVDPILLAL